MQCFRGCDRWSLLEVNLPLLPTGVCCRGGNWMTCGNSSRARGARDQQSFLPYWRMLKGRNLPANIKQNGKGTTYPSSCFFFLFGFVSPDRLFSFQSSWGLSIGLFPFLNIYVRSLGYLENGFCDMIKYFNLFSISSLWRLPVHLIYKEGNAQEIYPVSSSISDLIFWHFNFS